MEKSHFMKKEHSTTISRRSFIKATATTAVTFSIVSPQLVRGSEANSKINIGIIGCGGRGQWITDLFQKNGNYNIAAVSDYFQDRVDSAGKRFNVPESNRFTGLNGYKRLLDLKIDGHQHHAGHRLAAASRRGKAPALDRRQRRPIQPAVAAAAADLD